MRGLGWLGAWGLYITSKEVLPRTPLEWQSGGGGYALTLHGDYCLCLSQGRSSPCVILRDAVVICSHACIRTSKIPCPTLLPWPEL